MFDKLFEGDLLWFSLPAFVGTGIFLVRMVLMLLGGGSGDGGGDLDLGDADLGDGDFADGGDDSAEAFEVLSIQTLAVFAMGFGWTGIGCVFGTGLGTGLATLIGVLGGVVMVWILARALGAMRELESDGNVSIRQTLGLEGEVYARIPAHGEGRGQVQLVVGHSQRTFNAVSEAAELTTRTRVRVIGVNSDNTVTVQAV